MGKVYLVKDKNRTPFKNAVYRNGDGTFRAPDFYEVRVSPDSITAACDDSQVREVTYPKGMPDSSWVPEDKVDGGELVFVPTSEARDWIRKMMKEARDLTRKADFLARALERKRRR